MEPYYQDDYVTLYHGNCLDILPNLKQKFDLCLIDPPYKIQVNYGGYIGNIKNMERLRAADITDFDFNKYIPKIMEWQENKHFYFFCSKNQIHDYLSLFLKYKLRWDLLVMSKINPVPSKNNKYLSDLEFILFCRGKGCFFNNEAPFDYYRKNKIMTVKDRNYDHPTIKPLNIIKELITISTKEGQTILDCFAGTGTVGRAAKDLKRAAVLIEKEKKYCDIIVDRMKQECLPFAH